MYEIKKTLLSVYYCRVISMEYSRNCLMIKEVRKIYTKYQ